ncbi:hypothetical protein HNV12_00250 [Methanococcoides sp. SA1]|nr:hypothetical protein [Methanococcoides sp. SA1]
MGIVVEFNPDLALRKFGTDGRSSSECLPAVLIKGEVYSFLKKGQRMYWLNDDPEWFCGEVPLFETKGEGKLSRPLASIKILEATHFLKDGEVWTKGEYRVVDVFDIEDFKVNFEALKRLK